MELLRSFSLWKMGLGGCVNVKASFPHSCEPSVLITREFRGFSDVRQDLVATNCLHCLLISHRQDKTLGQRLLQYYNYSDGWTEGRRL